MSLWKDYLLEQRNEHVLETEDGFVTYKFFPTECYIVDIYVKPDKRQKGIAGKMADKVADIARERNVKYLTGSVATNMPTAHTSMLVLLGYGMKLLRSEGNMVYFVKELI